MRPDSTHAFVGESTRREGRFHVSASTRALFAPFHPPGGLKFPSYCHVPSFLPTAVYSSSQPQTGWGPLWKWQALIFLSHMKPCRQLLPSLRSRGLWETVRIRCLIQRDTAINFLVFSGQASLGNAQCTFPDPGKGRGQVSSFTWESRQRPTSCTMGQVAKWCSDSHRFGSKF